MMTKKIAPDFATPEALQMALQIFARAGRSSGRTEWLLDNARSGDIIAVPNNDVKRHVEMRLRQKKITEVTVRILPLDLTHELWPSSRRGFKSQRLFFDHSFVEDYFEAEIRFAGDRLQRIAKFFNIEHAPQADQEPAPYYSRGKRWEP